MCSGQKPARIPLKDDDPCDVALMLSSSSLTESSVDSALRMVDKCVLFWLGISVSFACADDETTGRDCWETRACLH